MGKVKSRKLNLEVVEAKGNCVMGYRVGDKWEIDDHLTIPDFCSHAYYLLYPWIQVLGKGGKILWQEHKDRIRIPCIDEKDTVVFEIKKRSS